MQAWLGSTVARNNVWGSMSVTSKWKGGEGQKGVAGKEEHIVTKLYTFLSDCTS
jgi:hypothetical protein